jgi:hypothetical protein
MALPPETHKMRARPQRRHMVSSAGVEKRASAVRCVLSVRRGERNTGTKESLDEATNAGRVDV